MKQRFLLKTMLLLCALVVGSSSVWADETQATLPFSYTSNGKPSGVTGFSDSGCGTYASAQTGIKFDGSGDYAQLSFKGNPGKLTFDILLNGSANANNEFTVSTSSDGSTFTVIKTYKGTAEIPTTTKSYSIEENEFPSGTRYIRWTYVTKGSGNVGMGNINLALGAPTFSLAAGEYVGKQTLTISTTSDYKLKYTTDGSDPEDAALFDGYTKDITIDADMTVRAVAVSGSKYSAETSAAYTILDDSAPVVTLSTDALAFGDVEVNKTKALTFTVTPANLTGDLTIASNNAKYTVSPTSIAEATTTETTITVTAAPTAANDDMDGQITISGGGIANKTVTLSATLYEIANVTLVATDSKGTFKQGDDAVTSITSRVGSSATVTAVPVDGYLFSSWSASGATPTSSTTATTEFTFTSTTPTLTANFIVDPRLFVTLEGSDMESMSNAGSGYGSKKSIIKNGLLWETTGYQTSDKKNMIQLKSSGSPYVKLPEFSGNIYSITFSVTDANATSKSGSGTSGTLHFKTTTDGTSIVSGGGSTTKEIVLNLSNIAQKYSTGYIVLTGNGARIWDITVAYIPTDINVSVSSAKYATFCDHLARDFSASGIEVYTAASNGSKVILSEIADGIVPANTGVVLFSDDVKNDVAIPLATSAGTGDFTGNEMIGINVKTKVAADGGSEKTNYILSKEASGVGFYKAATDGANLGAHKAYLSTTSAPAAPAFLGFSFEGEVTNVSEELRVKSEESVYDLQGRRVVNPTKGMYIVNGRKVVIK